MSTSVDLYKLNYKEFSNNPMTNIFFSKDIANMELLPYSK